MSHPDPSQEYENEKDLREEVSQQIISEQNAKRNKAVFLAQHPEYHLYRDLTERLPKYVRAISKLAKLKKQGKLDLPLNEKGLPF